MRLTCTAPSREAFWVNVNLKTGEVSRRCMSGYILARAYANAGTPFTAPDGSTWVLNMDAEQGIKAVRI